MAGFDGRLHDTSPSGFVNQCFHRKFLRGDLHICSHESLLMTSLPAKARVVDLFCPWWNPLVMASNWQSNESLVMLDFLH